MLAFKKLFEPIKMGSVEIKNRFAYAPTNLVYNWWDGLVNEQDLAYYTARAMGGTGLIIYGAALSTRFGVPYIQNPWPFCHDITHVPGLFTLAENMRLAGAVSFIQLIPVTSRHGRGWTGIRPVAPSAGLAVPDYAPPRPKIITNRIPGSWAAHNIGLTADAVRARAATIDEIQTVIKENTHSCRLAALAGFEGIELHTCHGYWVDSFRDPRTNHRKDRYGGSEDNRNRLILELTEEAIRAAKKENPNMIMGVRVSSATGEGGFTFEETKRLALQLQELGCDYYHVTAGSGQFWPADQDGYLLNFGKELKKILKIPVITPSVHDPELAERAIAEGWTDMVSLARPLIADPEYVNKVKKGRPNDIIKCTMCGLHEPADPKGLALPARCAVNPEAGFERYNPRYQIKKGFKGAAMLPHVLRRKKTSR
jgi:2-enoate reductase